MTESDLKLLEKELKLTLPSSYRKLVGNFPDELRNWPERSDPAASDRRDDFLLDAKQLLKANQRARKKLKKEFPANGFVIGGSGDDWWLINAGSKNSPVELIHDDYVLDGFDNLAELFAAVQADHKDAWGRAKKRSRAGSKATLAPADLIAEGRRLARPAVALYDKGSNYAALWRGTSVVSPGAGDWCHWISIDTRFLPENPRKLKGVVSVYEWFADDDRMGELNVVHDSKATLPGKSDGKRLFARTIDCMPDVDAVFEFGSKPIKDWVKSGAWDPATGYDASPVKEYLKVVRAEHPYMADDGAYAMLGGWSWCFTWCYGIDEKYPWHLLKKALIVLTIAESEPWIEVFDDGRKFVTFSRIT